MTQANLAREVAQSAHIGQVDKIGESYIGHPARVAAAVRSETGNDEATAVAWLHDVVEDCPVTLDDLREYGFTEAVVQAVDAISKRKGESFADYYERVKANPLALVVKWHDVADNADPRRLAKVAPDTRERLRVKYEKAKALLAKAETVEPLLGFNTTTVKQMCPCSLASRPHFRTDRCPPEKAEPCGEGCNGFSCPLCRRCTRECPNMRCAREVRE
jgi:hypothetical protein